MGPRRGLIGANFTGHVTTLLAVASAMRAQRGGTIVVLSSVAAIRPRKANFTYGATKAGLDAFARGLADSLHGTGVRVLLVRPGLRHRPDDRGHAARPAVRPPPPPSARPPPPPFRGPGQPSGSPAPWPACP